MNSGPLFNTATGPPRTLNLPEGDRRILQDWKRRMAARIVTPVRLREFSGVFSIMRAGFIAGGAAVALLVGTGTVRGQDARTLVTTAARTMGADTLKAVTLTGSGSV